MDTALVGSEAVDLLSRITGHRLSQSNLTPPVIFLAALVTVLVGVMFADDTVAEEEKQNLLTTLYRFSPPESDVRRLTHLMIKGVRENQVYAFFERWQTLIAPLSEAERLLLIGFGYEMSAIDGNIDTRENNYLEAVAEHLEIKAQHLAVIKAGFSAEEIFEAAALDEVQSLLAPSRFQSLDTIFVKAASDILASLPVRDKHQNSKQHRRLSYDKLQKFQEYRQQLDNVCSQLLSIIQECDRRGVVSHTLTEDIEKAYQKLLSQRFRLAVIGEFSQGKSTLLNALLGAEIQPVREIPCTGTVTVLKYGQQRRIVCRYQDGMEEEIPFEMYQEKAAIPEEVALDCLSNELPDSQIEEIIFEHPDLLLCNSGVEIVDSPGLNENPNRTAITQKLLKDTDAVIFMTNALRPLTEGEREFIQELKIQLNGGKADSPADNLFLVANFMDLLRSEKGRQQVQQRIERLVLGENAIVAGENRVHLISAQSALDAILEGTENEYLSTFQHFTESIEKFLILERGTLEIKQSVTKLNSLTQLVLDALEQAEQVLDDKLNFSEAEKQKILEQIGEASGREVKIRLLADQLLSQSLEQAAESWNKWFEGLGDRLEKHAQKWSSKHNYLWSQKKVIQDYVNQFSRDLEQEINDWEEQELQQKILNKRVELLNDTIVSNLEAIQGSANNLVQQVNTNFSNQINLAIAGINNNFIVKGAWLGGMGFGGALAAALIVFTSLGLVPVILASLAAVVGGEFGLEKLDFYGITNKIKHQVIELGLKNLQASKYKIAKKRYEIIRTEFYTRLEAASKIITQVISVYENLLEQQENAHKKTLEQREAEKAWIAQKLQELNQVEENLETILTSQESR